MQTGDPRLHGRAAVRRQYEEDWTDHRNVVVSVRQVYEAEGKAAAEIHVRTGPSSKLHYDGVVAQHWNNADRLTR